MITARIKFKNSAPDNVNVHQCDYDGNTELGSHIFGSIFHNEEGYWEGDPGINELFGWDHGSWHTRRAAEEAITEKFYKAMERS